ncbi:putative bifunctional diguanylate cyclase/phosphodiesterase [Quadrisphaera oryzae]|uniref:putative bifunctional diguanylate cyclase/phosphodiesterase n=1 Tax=Quadrisphaera TaxID=317661 RepID=UPI00164604BE|nr:bifunctional diguanylate cyclase/phosphodiesterase [Quadrisphaera sp. RL12-1S]MBC3761181.1 bifunctional diguanylate cyclase/phosphodiesterase [Quadrisphaera sp. RL12-1S]
MSAVSGWLYVFTGLLVIASTYLPTTAPERGADVVRLVNAAAVGAGVLMLVLRMRLPRLTPHVATFGGVLLITAALLSSGGGAGAAAYAAVYCLSPAYSFLCLPPRWAYVHLALTVLVGAPALASQPGVGLAEQLVLWGVVLLLGVASGFMARALLRAEVDSLTGLRNRKGVERALHEAAGESGSHVDLTYAVLDLDHFKAYNDGLGSAAGDRLLQAVAKEWAALTPRDGTLARLGADEFALVMPGWSPARTGALLVEMHDALPQGVTCSAGVAGREPGESVSMLVTRTESALYTAKREGRARTHQHPGVGRDGREVHEGLARGEFLVHFQPIVDLQTGELAAAEALVRWQHPAGGLIPPVEFLPGAEQSGAISELGEWVLREACQQAARWPAGPDGRVPYVTVNSSGRELQDPEYAQRVARALADSGLPAERLVIELVESHYDIESLHLASNLHALKASGVRTAMDDFGVGYSSLDRLRRSGVDILKIDKSFTSDIRGLSSQAPLVSAILAMAGALGMRVVAEGIEDAEQAQWLRARGCDLGQGWYFGRPAGTAPSVTKVARSATA